MWFRRKPEDFQAELDAHLALEADELRAEGAPDSDAAARRALGNRTSAEERFFEGTRVKIGSWMFGQHLLRDLRFATRVLRKEPKFSVLTILGLALGIAVSTALFAFVSWSANGRGTGFRPPDDVSSPATYVSINRIEYLGDFSVSEFRYLQDHSSSVEQITAESEPINLVLGAPNSDPEETLARFDSPNFLSVRGFHVQLGRTFGEEEERTRAFVAVLSDSFWHRRFGADPGVLGQTILLNNHAATVIGVAEPRFHSTDLAEIFLPLDLTPLQPANLQLILNARLRPGGGSQQVQDQIQSLVKSFEEANPSASPYPDAPLNLRSPRASVFIGPLPPDASRQRSEQILGLDLAIAMILLIACSNLASLLLARATVRRRELGVRLSLGASRARLIGQLLTESLLLSTCGGLLGLLFSNWLTKWLQNAMPGARGPLDQRVLLYGLLLSVVTGVSFGLGPALAVTKTNLAQALRSEGMAGNAASALSIGWSRRNLLVVVPLAASLMLLIGGSILIRGAENLGFVQTSFDSSHVITLAFRLKDQGYDDARAAQFRRDLRDRFRALPGVVSAAITDDSPLVAGTCQIQAPPPGSYPVCHRVSPEFFETLDLPILRGRPFTSADRPGAAPVAVVSQNLADKLLAGREPLGQRIQIAGGGTAEIVGVVSDIELTSGPVPSYPTVYIPTGQAGNTVLTGGRWIDRMELLVRSNGDPGSLEQELRQVVRAADPSLWVNIQTVGDYLGRFNGNARLAIFILTTLGALVLLMASAGIYALLAYSVNQRTREIGIRIALGARNREILALVMRRTILLIAWGISLGLIGAIALGRILAAVIPNTPPPDVLTCIEVAVLLAAVSLLASYLPARKALRVNPVEALRCE
jgi:predicted permease